MLDLYPVTAFVYLAGVKVGLNDTLKNSVEKSKTQLLPLEVGVIGL